MNNNSCSCGGSFMSGLLIGAVVGGAVALLYSPKSGKENRAFLRKKALQARDVAVDKFEDVKEEAIELKDKAEKAVKAAEKEFKKS
ncbi:YtxH domain-containing protein [Patescibacteria group bacterium]